MSDDLAQFLLARIAEDEGWARAATRKPSYGWADDAFTEAVELADGEGAVGEATQHIARWDPARVLAECAAKRRIVELHDGEDDACLEPGFSSPGNCDTLRLLALPYADHEGFREEWKVQ